MNILKSKSNAVNTLKWTREVAAMGGAATGITVIWGMVFFSVADATGSNFVGGVAAIVGIAIGLFIIDFSYRRNFPYVADLIVSGQAFKSWRLGLFTFLLLVLSGAQMVSSAFLSWEGRKDVAEGIIKAPELEDVASVKVASDKTSSAKIREVKAQISKLDTKISEIEKQVEENHPTYMEKIRSGEDKWGWYAGQLDKKKTKAVGTLRQERANLSEGLAVLVGNQSEADKVMIQAIASQNQTKIDQYSIKKERNMRFLGYFGVGCLAFVAFISVMLSLIGYSDIEEVDMKQTKSPFRQTPQALPTSPPPGPKTIPVRSNNQFDSYEIARRQEMQEARIQEQARQLESMQANTDNILSEKARQIRQLEEKAEKLEAEKLELSKQSPDKSKSNPLSDKEAGKLSVKITDRGIVVGGEVYGIAELSKLKDNAQKWYNRQFTSKTDKGRQSNAEKWNAILPALKKIGAEIVYKPGNKVSIEGGSLKV